MRSILTAIVITLSMLVLDARPVMCQEATTSQASTPATSPAQTSIQQQQSTTPQAAAQKPVQLDERARKIKRTVEKVGVAGKLTLYLKNGEDLYGNVVAIDEESFQITEVDLKRVVTIQYKNIKKVREGHGTREPFTGKRSNWPKGANIALAAGVFFVVIGLPIIALRGTK